MPKKVFTAIIVLMSLISFAVFQTQARNTGNFKKHQNPDDNFIYTYAFNLLVVFENRADNAQDESGKQFLKNYFKDEAKLTDEHYENLKIIASNFVDAYRASSKRQRFKLSSLYKKELRKVFYDDEFYRFDAFIKTRLAPSITIIKLGPVNYFGSTGISVNETTHELRGVAGIGFNDSLNNPNSTPCSASATMTGANVSVSGSDSADCDQRLAGVTLLSTAYSDNSQYCITGTFTAGGQSVPSSTSCLITPGVPRVTNISYEQIDATDLLIDVNPNAGGGLRIFADRKDSADQIDRRKIRIRAKYGIPTANTRIYFRSFDVDDPSANNAPIDAETTANAGDDNNGNVDGTASTKAGLLSFPQPPNPNPFDCRPFPKGVSCLTDANGEAFVDFTVTQQPGDNFTVAASPDEIYLTDLTLAPDGINLKDTGNVQMPVATRTSNACLTSTVNACRADMLTVWRRLHIEIDSMGNVGSSNSVTGQITAIGTYSDPNCTPNQIPTCYSTVTVYDVSTTPSLESHRFDDGRIFFGRYGSYQVYYNEPASGVSKIVLKGNPSGSTNLKIGLEFTLYDDDDYNADDGFNKDGDKNEPIIRLPDSFRYLSDDLTGGNHSDGKPKNMYASAYILPEYNWAENVKQYNQTNLQFELNVEDGTNAATLINVINRNRDSRNDENNSFWVGYILIGYQGPLLKDFDGLSPNGATNEDARQGVSPEQYIIGAEIPVCDCYISSNCPSGGSICSLPNGTPALPHGSFGSLIFQEVNQDLKRYFSLLQPPYTPRTIEDIKLTIPHELGHQFGLLGDQKRTTFEVMDYSNYIGNVVNDETFHPEHINIMRRRVKSPGD